jgi:hypothetical protein
VHIIACRSIVARSIPQEKKTIAVELGGQPREASWMLTFFPFEQGKPGAYSTYTINNVSFFTLNKSDVLCTTCRVLK